MTGVKCPAQENFEGSCGCGQWVCEMCIRRLCVDKGKGEEREKRTVDSKMYEQYESQATLAAAGSKSQQKRAKRARI